MKKITLLLTFVLFPFLTILNAEYRLNFFVGDVRIETSGKSVEPRLGMTIPGSAIIITGKRSQAHLFETSRGIVINIQPGKRVNIASLSSVNKSIQPAIWQRLRKENHSSIFTAAGAIRGAEDGKVKIEWDDGNGFSVKEKDRTGEWKLFVDNNYSKVISLTKNASDTDGIFLHAASTYYMLGNGTAGKVVPALENIIAGDTASDIKTESYSILAAINFEIAKFDHSYKYMTAAVENVPESKIGETGYFILAQSAFNINRLDEGREYLRKMRKYHGRSSLLGKIIER